MDNILCRMEASRPFHSFYDVQQPRQEPDIISSFYERNIGDDDEENRMSQRQQYWFSLLSASSSSASSSTQQSVFSVVTVTANQTVYNFQTASMKKFYSLVVANAFLQCLPAGYSVC